LRKSEKVGLWRVIGGHLAGSKLTGQIVSLKEDRSWEELVSLSAGQTLLRGVNFSVCSEAQQHDSQQLAVAFLWG
jgi:hypothetical protein